MHEWTASPETGHALLCRGPDIGEVKVPKFHLDEHEGEPEIRCPLCHWQPRPSSKWFCAFCPHPEGLLRGCGTMWNTFDTRGRCPGCQHQWRWTSCLSCGGWSLHEDWYVEDKRDKG